MITVICADCGHVWVAPVILGGPVQCPKCKGDKIHVAVEKG